MNLPMAKSRWWTYQRERFPLAAYAPMTLVFCVAVLTFSASARAALMVAWPVIGAAFASVLLLFAQMRIADEFKDRDIDARYRPERAVPRGLVRLPELARLAWAAGALQLALALAVDVRLAVLLLALWAYLALMTCEFFASRWLTSHSVAYLLSHMLIMPLTALYVSAFDWLPAGAAPVAELAWVATLSFVAGLVLEIGRKIRAPAHERVGVETYSATWGVGTAITAWLGAVALTGVLAIAAARHGDTLLIGITAIALSLAALLAIGRFRRRPALGHGREFDLLSGTTVLATYLALTWQL